MSIDLILIIVFYGLIILYYLKNKKKFEIQNGIFAIYRTKIGLKLMDKARKYSRFFNILSYISISVGFMGMAFILYYLTKGTLNLLLIPSSAPALAPVIPGVKVEGLPVLSFWYWIISILIVAVIHEFSHGVFSRVFNIKIKSSGFAFMGPILAAFVEPDEKELEKKTKREQLAVFSAGPFSNIALAGIIGLIIILLNPFVSSLYDYNGIRIYDVTGPSKEAGLIKGSIINVINGIDISNNNDFTASLKNLKPGDNVNIQTTNGTFNVSAGTLNSKGYLGLFVSADKKEIKPDLINKYGNWIFVIVEWIVKLFFWLFIINLGVGLFNLLPLGPVDGGRMFKTGISYFIKNKKLINKIYMFVTFLCLTFIVINLLPWIWKLVLFLYNGILLLLSIL